MAHTVAQAFSATHWRLNPETRGSAARIWARRGVAQPGSASGLGPEGRRFESFRPDHFTRVSRLGAANHNCIFARLLRYFPQCRAFAIHSTRLRLRTTDGFFKLPDDQGGFVLELIPACSLVSLISTRRRSPPRSDPPGLESSGRRADDGISVLRAVLRWQVVVVSGNPPKGAIRQGVIGSNLQLRMEGPSRSRQSDSAIGGKLQALRHPQHEADYCRFQLLTGCHGIEARGDKRLKYPAYEGRRCEQRERQGFAPGYEELERSQTAATKAVSRNCYRSLLRQKA